MATEHLTSKTLPATEIRQIITKLDGVREGLEHTAIRLSGLKCAIYAMQADLLSDAPMAGEQIEHFVILLLDACDGLLSRLTDSDETLAKIHGHFREQAGDSLCREGRA